MTTTRVAIGSLCAIGVGALALIGLGACTEPQQPSSQDNATLTAPGFVPAQASAVVPTLTPPPLVMVVSEAPPAAPVVQMEPIPPSPGGGAVWLAGYWQWTGVAGSNWQWVPGQYVLPPATATRWVPGTWSHEPGRGWIWVDGHWT